MPTTEEVAVALEETQSLILREPTTLTFQRPTPDESDGAGGWIKQDGFTPVDEQTLFLSAVTRDSDYRQSSFVQDSDGEKYVNHFIIIGMPDLDVQEYDEFDHQGFRYRVSFVHPEKRWQCKAEADRTVSGDG